MKNSCSSMIIFILRQVLRQALSDHRLLLYEGDSYISFSRLHDVLGARIADIESYAPAVSVDAPEGEPIDRLCPNSSTSRKVSCTRLLQRTIRSQSARTTPTGS